MATTTLSQIPTLSDLYKHNQLRPASPSSVQPGATSKHNSKISLIRADITTLSIDSIVNAANTSLLGGGGVDGAIHRAAGPQLYDECEALDGCDTGDAKITYAYDLPCKRVIHAVGPVYYSMKREGRHTSLLQSCYTRSLDLAVENGCRSIAFSALSTGIYGYPSEEAAETALGAVRGWLDGDEERAGRMERMMFCCFMERDERAYEMFLPQFFPSSQEGGESESKGEGEPKLDDDGKAEDGETPTLDLPDVPTQEPGAEDGQPDLKKPRLDGDADGESEKS